MDDNLRHLLRKLLKESSEEQTNIYNDREKIWMKTRHSDYFSPQHLRKTASLFTLTLSASYSKNMMLQSLLLGKYRKMKKQTKLPSSTIYNLQFTMMKWARSECVPDKAVMRYVILQDKLEHTKAWIHQPVSSMKRDSKISSIFSSTEIGSKTSATVSSLRRGSKTLTSFVND